MPIGKIRCRRARPCGERSWNRSLGRVDAISSHVTVRRFPIVPCLHEGFVFGRTVDHPPFSPSSMLSSGFEPLVEWSCMAVTSLAGDSSGVQSTFQRWLGIQGATKACSRSHDTPTRTVHDGRRAAPLRGGPSSRWITFSAGECSSGDDQTHNVSLFTSENAHQIGSGSNPSRKFKGGVNGIPRGGDTLLQDPLAR